jgi:hypothetical protein
MKRKLYKRRKKFRKVEVEGDECCGTCVHGWSAENPDGCGHERGSKLVREVDGMVEVRSPCSGQVNYYPITTTIDKETGQEIRTSCIKDMP